MNSHSVQEGSYQVSFSVNVRADLVEDYVDYIFMIVH